MDSLAVKEIDNGTIRNNPITPWSARVAEAVYGPLLANLKGNSKYKIGAPALTEIVDVPEEIIKHHKDVILEMDVFWVNGLALVYYILLYILNYCSVHHASNT